MVVIIFICVCWYALGYYISIKTFMDAFKTVTVGDCLASVIAAIFGPLAIFIYFGCVYGNKKIWVKK